METGILNENPNSFHWKNKLENTDDLSAELLQNKNAAWEKLHSRLRKKPGRKKAIWYWAAAASVVMAISIPLIIANNKQINPEENIRTQVQPKKITAPENSLLNEDAITINSPSSNKKSKTEKITIKKSLVNNIEKKEQTITANVNTSPLIQDSAIALTPVNDSIIKTSIVVTPLKKMLKVVHINELGSDAENNSNVAQHSERQPLQIKFINQEAYTKFTIPAVTGFHIFKLNTTSSN